MKLRDISVITINMAADFEQNSPTKASMETRQVHAISVRFEISADEIELLRLKEEATTEMGKAITKALLAFVQAEDAVGSDKETNRNLQ